MYTLKRRVWKPILGENVTFNELIELYSGKTKSATITYAKQVLLYEGFKRIETRENKTTLHMAVLPL